MPDIEKRISPDSCIICISTENQTVNVLPVLQYDIKNVIILSTSRADNAGWTKRMKDYLDRLQKNTQVQRINNEVEGNINLLSEFIYNLLKEKKSVVFNISGGQKIHFLGLYDTFLKRKSNDDLLCYVDANTYEIIFYDIERNINTDNIRTLLSLNNVLNLYGIKSESVCIYPDLPRDKQEYIEIGRKAYKAFLNHCIFREAFYAYGRPIVTPEDIGGYDKLKDFINDLLKSNSDIKNFQYVKSNQLKSLEHLIFGLFRAAKEEDLEKIADIKKKFDNIYLDDIFCEIKNDIVEQLTAYIIKSLNPEEQVIISEDSGYKDSDLIILKKIIEDIGGQLSPGLKIPLLRKNIKRLSIIGSPGILFEWMVAAYIYDLIKDSEDLKRYINNVNMNVLLTNIDNQSSIAFSELDLVITTKIGALIILELKTYKLEADTAKSKEYVAKRSSGSYGRAIIVSPMLTSDKISTEDGITAYADYINTKLRDQEYIALRNNIKFWFFDEIKDKLPKEIMPKGK